MQAKWKFKMTREVLQALEEWLVEFLRHEVRSRGFDKVLVGVSGGVDSALVARLCQKAFGRNLHALFMPSSVSSKESLEHAKALCEQFSISYDISPITPLENAFREAVKPDHPLRLGNACARFRMILLYDLAFAQNRLVIGTGNRSEILLGYSTLYGDTACAINPIGELYKNEVYELAAFLEIPTQILSKPPSAELIIGQEDEVDLGFSYAQIDTLLYDLSEQELDHQALLQAGHPLALIEMVEERIERNAFKRALPPLAPVRQWLKTQIHSYH